MISPKEVCCDEKLHFSKPNKTLIKPADLLLALVRARLRGILTREALSQQHQYAVQILLIMKCMGIGMPDTMLPERPYHFTLNTILCKGSRRHYLDYSGNNVLYSVACSLLTLLYSA